ncbi:MAG: hypothetical protein EBZ77_14560, partial [Chitinophagia bacterium]|nr:hypothetical protein [Chitinophagia bacterium]
KIIRRCDFDKIYKLDINTPKGNQELKNIFNKNFKLKRSEYKDIEVSFVAYEPATAATINYPGAIALDPMGNLFFTDADNRVVRKISATGIITRVLGYPFRPGSGGIYGRSDGADYDFGFDLSIAPINAIAADRWGNLFFAEGWNVQTVRRMDTAGVVHALAGIEYNAGYTGDGGPATNAQLWGVSGLALDASGHLFASEADNNTIREISLCNPAPTTSVASTTGTICTGFSNDLTFYCSGPDSYWYSSDTTIASIKQVPYYTFVYGGGFYATLTGESLGTAVITMVNREICGLRTTVTDTITVGPGIGGSIVSPRTICLGGTVAFTDTFSGGTWTSYNPTIASVSTTGVVTGLDTGFATISYSATIACGLSIDTQMIRVIAGSTVSAGTISGTSVICTGTTTILSDTASGGAWSSNATGIASVSATGVVYGVSPGTAIIRYMVAGTCNTDTATFNITITSTPTAGTISGPSTVCAGSSIALTDSVTGGIWTSSNVAVASVSATGAVTGITSGVATISYTV